MRTTLNIDEAKLRSARQLTGVQTTTRLVEMGLEALIARESARRLARLGGSEPHLRSPPRPRFGSAKGLIDMADDFDAPLDDFTKCES